MRVDEEYMEREHVSVVDDWNYSHNLSYLIASDAEAGRYREALKMAAKLDQLPVVTARAVGSPRFAIKEGSTTARLEIRFGQWRKLRSILSCWATNRLRASRPARIGMAFWLMRPG